MTDQNSQFFAILTAVGEAKQANADALGIAWRITQMGVGDANGTDPVPDRLQTTLLNERRRAPLNQLKVDPNNASIIIAEQVIPEDVGGWWIREIGLYDEAGDLVAVASCAPSFKPQLSQGSGRTQVVRMNLIVSSTENVQLKIDPAVVLATRQYVDDELAKRDHKNSVRVATTANIALSGTQTIDGIAVVDGDRVLVKNQIAAAENGIYIASSLAWKRATDADASIEVTPGMLVPVEQGVTNADSVWQLATDGLIVLGTTTLTFEASAGPSGVSAGTYRSVTVDKRGRVTGGTNPTTLAGYGITDALPGSQAAVLAPPGQVAAFAMSAAPSGWLKANGAAISRTTYAALFAAIGTTFGIGDGSTTFNLPDLRGEFLRGWDNGRGADNGRAFGSFQDHAVELHNHTLPTGAGSLDAASGVWGVKDAYWEEITGPTPNTTPATNEVAVTWSSGNQAYPATVAGNYASETRPRNIALLACIKY